MSEPISDSLATERVLAEDRRNHLHALRLDLAALEVEMDEAADATDVRLGMEIRYWADRLAAIRKAHEPPR